MGAERSRRSRGATRTRQAWRERSDKNSARRRAGPTGPVRVPGPADIIERMSNSQPIRLGVVGTGYVGLTTGACFAHLGHMVTCGDVDARKVDLLNGGAIPIVEDGLAQVVSDARAAGRLEFVLGAEAAAADADIVFLCVPTPQGDDGSADLSYIEAGRPSDRARAEAGSSRRQQVDRAGRLDAGCRTGACSVMTSSSSPTLSSSARARRCPISCIPIAS